MEEVAARAGVGKPTVYRWWPDRHAVAMAALMQQLPPAAPRTASRRSRLASLRIQLQEIGRVFATNTGRHITALIAASDRDSELAKAFRGHFVLARRLEGKALLERAKAENEVDANLDIDAALDLLYGALFLRLLVGHAPLSKQAINRVFETALSGMRVTPTQPVGRKPRAPTS
jgi:AcrR family transcriptional regulator